MDFDFAASSRRRRREPVDALRELASLEFVRAQLQGAHGAQPFKTPPHASQHSVSTPDVRRTLTSGGGTLWAQKFAAYG